MIPDGSVIWSRGRTENILAFPSSFLPNPCQCLLLAHAQVEGSLGARTQVEGSLGALAQVEGSLGALAQVEGEPRSICSDRGGAWEHLLR